MTNSIIRTFVRHPMFVKRPKWNLKIYENASNRPELKDS